MIISLSTALPAPAQTIFEQVKRSVTLYYVSGPFIRFVPEKAFPAVWKNGTYETRMRLFVVLPLGRQLIRIEMPENPATGPFRLRDNGQGQLAQTWDHWITVSSIAPDRCLYTDTITVRAGLLTTFVWLFAFGFYAWRQYRWRQFVQTRIQSTDQRNSSTPEFANFPPVKKP